MNIKEITIEECLINNIAGLEMSKVGDNIHWIGLESQFKKAEKIEYQLEDMRENEINELILETI